MSKLLKKSLACCLAIALCLTMAVGAITASADTNTIVVGEVSVANDAESVDLPITITTTGINVATLTIKLPASEDATINAITDIAAEGAVATWKTGDNTVSDSTAEEFVAPVVSGNKITLMVNAIDSTGVFTEAVITITYSLADVAVGTYAVEVTASEAYDNNKDDANLVALTATAGSITVTQAAHDCVAGEPVVESEVAPTCKVEGSRVEVIYCSICNAEMSRSTIVVPVVDHTPGEVVIENSVAPSCSAAGSYENVTYCTVCEEECSRETIEVDPTEHTASDPVVENTVDATCEVDGSFDTVIYCGVCGHEISRVTSTVAALGHEYDAVVTAPTCEAAGYTTYTCKNDASHTYVGDEVAALGHEYTYNNDGDTHSATCDNGCAGITGEAHNYVDGECVCGAVEKVACEHVWGEWIVTVHPTSKNGYQGVKQRICSVCGEVEETGLTDKITVTGLKADYAKGQLFYSYDASAEFVTAISDANKAALGNSDRKFYIVLGIAQGGKFVEFPVQLDSIAAYVTNKNLVGFSFENMDCDMQVSFRLTYVNETEGLVVIDTEKYDFNMVDYIEAQYASGTLSEEEAAKVAKDIAFNNILVANKDKQFDVAVTNDDSGEYTTYFTGVKINLYSGTLVYGYDNRTADGKNTSNYIKLISAKNPNAANSQYTSRDFYINLTFNSVPTTFLQTEVAAYKTGRTLVGLFGVGMKNDFTLSTTLTWEGVDSGSVTTNPATANILNSLATSDDELAVAFVEYINSIS